MIAIGFRVTPKKVYYAVIKAEANDTCEVISKDEITFPKYAEPAQQLKNLRETLNNLIFEFKATCGGIRLIETNSRNRDPFRLNVEGVIQETLASANFDRMFCGIISQIGAALKETGHIKDYITGKNFSKVAEWAEYSKEEREAILTAFAAIHTDKKK